MFEASVGDGDELPEGSHPALGRVPAVPFDPRALESLAYRITAGLGIRLPQAKFRMLHARVQRRVRELGLSTLNEYERLLDDPEYGPGEEVNLFDLATTNKTEFFRDPRQLDYFANVGLTGLADRLPRGEPLRVWCAGCSTGEEVYTLAVLLAEFGLARPGFDWSIWATDISTQVLEYAAAATYPIERIELMPRGFRQRYFLRGRREAEGLVRVAPELRSRVRFSRLNFMDARYFTPGPFDVIFFRNVLIYFDRHTQVAVVQRQCQHLVRDGHLYVALVETLGGLDVPLAPVGPSAYRRLP